MRLVVARCEVHYTGRLTAVLPEAVRLLIFKSDGSVLELHSEGVPPAGSCLAFWAEKRAVCGQPLSGLLTIQ